MSVWLTRAVCAALFLSGGVRPVNLGARPAPDTPPSLVISPPSVDFGPQAVDTASAPRTVILSNSASTALSISVLSSGIDFSQSNNCGESLAAGASCNVEVMFKPAIPGERIGTLTVTDSNGARTQLVVLTGTGK